MFVTAIRITYTHHNDLHSMAAFEAYWKRTDQIEFTKHSWPNEQHYFWPFLQTGSKPHTATIYINDTIDELFISPDRVPCQFSVSDLTLLTPQHACGTVESKSVALSRRCPGTQRSVLSLQ